jgi:hypothetical protein
MVELEEEKDEVSCYTAKKEAHIYHHYVMPCSWPFGEAIYNSPRVACISRWDKPCVVHKSPIVARIFRWAELFFFILNILSVISSVYTDIILRSVYTDGITNEKDFVGNYNYKLLIELFFR